jgi:hypothetical protein
MREKGLFERIEVHPSIWCSKCPSLIEEIFQVFLRKAPAFCWWVVYHSLANHRVEKILLSYISNTREVNSIISLVSSSI